MKRILIVDDEPDFTWLVRLYLEKNGDYCVQEENDPTKALDTARRFGPDLILLDIMMPVIDGGELAAHFVSEEAFHHVPIIFLTALVSEAEVHKGEWDSIGNRVYLPKSLSFKCLIQCIEQGLKRPEPALVC